ncbi:hypothetical protein [Streptomyces griseus]|uniref:hypothetical protein n=1 Tax=Streptomyces griseus TaxID=1911 RepID=UPI000A364750|nr:hypothetical protein [Streptomyces fimicarius]
MAVITTPSITTTIPAGSLEIGMIVSIDSTPRRVFDLTTTEDGIRARIEGLTDLLALSPASEISAILPITPVSVRAADLADGMVIRLDGAFRRVTEVAVAEDSVRARIEGFTDLFTLSLDWEYDTYIGA